MSLTGFITKFFETTSSVVALKTSWNVCLSPFEDDATKKDLKDILTELDLMKSLKPHPHVVRLIGCCTEKGTKFDLSMKSLAD